MKNENRNLVKQKPELCWKQTIYLHVPQLIKEWNDAMLTCTEKVVWFDCKLVVLYVGGKRGISK